MRDKHLMQGDLLQVATTVVKAKKRDGNWMLQGIPFLILWLGWFFYELYEKYGNYYIFIPAIIGGLIGGGIGLNIHFKTQRKYKEILERIEEVKE